MSEADPMAMGDPSNHTQISQNPMTAKLTGEVLRGRADPGYRPHGCAITKGYRSPPRPPPRSDRVLAMTKPPTLNLRHRSASAAPRARASSPCGRAAEHIRATAGHTDGGVVSDVSRPQNKRRFDETARTVKANSPPRWLVPGKLLPGARAALRLRLSTL